jgi:hypothetical protein
MRPRGFLCCLVIAQYSVQPLADIICDYARCDGNQKGFQQSLSPLSVARLGFGDNAAILTRISPAVHAQATAIIAEKA